jgi:hypothetical protein
LKDSTGVIQTVCTDELGDNYKEADKLRPE